MMWIEEAFWFHNVPGKSVLAPEPDDESPGRYFSEYLPGGVNLYTASLPSPTLIDYLSAHGVVLGDTEPVGCKHINAFYTRVTKYNVSIRNLFYFQSDVFGAQTADALTAIANAVGLAHPAELSLQFVAAAQSVYRFLPVWRYSYAGAEKIGIGQIYDVFCLKCKREIPDVIAIPQLGEPVLVHPVCGCPLALIDDDGFCRNHRVNSIEGKI